MAISNHFESGIIPKSLYQNWNQFIKQHAENLELEVRFGYFDTGYSNSEFVSQLPDQSLFHNLCRHLDNFVDRHPEEVLRTESCYTVEIDNNVRRISNENNNMYQEKNNIERYDNYDWGLRFSKSQEIHVPAPINFNPKITRKVKRVSYEDKRPYSDFYGFRIDLSKVNGRYELELEAIDIVNEIDKWARVILTLYGWMLDAVNEKQIISISERIFVTQLINRLVLDRDQIEIDPRLVNRPITLMNILDIDNKAVSLKLDGVHKILVFDEFGIYSCSGPFSVQKIGDNKWSQTTIIECEYLAETNTFYGFDILVHNDFSVTELTLLERRELLEKFTHNLNLFEPYHIEIKPIYYPEDHDRLSFDFYNNSLPIDGLIFQSLGNYEQKIHKWKPTDQLTADFILKSGGENIWIPYSWDRNSPVELDAIVIGFDEDYTDKIVECKWSYELGAWLPTRLRTDRDLPNYLNTVNNIIEMIAHPITFDHIQKSLYI